MQASAAPLDIRFTASSIKLWAHACNIGKKPHMNMLTQRHFPIGKNCSIKFFLKSSGQETKVEYGGELIVLGMNQIEIFPDAKDGGIR